MGINLGMCQPTYQNNTRKQVHMQVSINDEVQNVIMDVSTFACTSLVIHVDKNCLTCTLVAHVRAIISLPKKEVAKKNNRCFKQST